MADNLVPKSSHVMNIHVALLTHFLPKQKKKYTMQQTIHPFNLLEPEFYIQILARSVGKMRIIQEPNKVAL